MNAQLAISLVGVVIAAFAAVIAYRKFLYDKGIQTVFYRQDTILGPLGSDPYFVVYLWNSSKKVATVRIHYKLSKDHQELYLRKDSNITITDDNGKYYDFALGPNHSGQILFGCIGSAPEIGSNGSVNLARGGETRYHFYEQFIVIESKKWKAGFLWAIFWVTIIISSIFIDNILKIKSS